jgi:rhomboid family GlyGly-CTERM serine protease
MKTLRVPLLLFALPAAFVALWPSVGERLVLDRAALIERGEIWRLWTGHWVHFSTSHLLWNLAVLFAAGAWLERVRPGLLWRHAVFAAPLIGLTVLVCEPRLLAYGGLSGLATGVVVLLALHQLRTRGAPRLLWGAVLALVAVKSAHDLASPDALFARYDLPTVRPSSTAHAAGAVAAVLHYSLARWRECGRFPTVGAFRGRS